MLDFSMPQPHEPIMLYTQSDSSKIWRIQLKLFVAWEGGKNPIAIDVFQDTQTIFVGFNRVTVNDYDPTVVILNRSGLLALTHDIVKYNHKMIWSPNNQKNGISKCNLSNTSMIM